MGPRRLWWPMAVMASLVAGCGSGTRAAPAVVRVTPASGLYDVSRSIVVSHLAPGEVVTISASTPRPNGLGLARATYKAKGAGVIDLTRAAPESGSYRGVSAMGLLWSEHLVPAGAAAPSPSVTTLRVTAGGRQIGSGTVTQLLSGPGVTKHVETLAKVGFVGRYFAPPGGATGPSAAAARIPIERFKGPLMLISGGADELWPSTVFADRIMAALHAVPADHRLPT